MIRYFKDVLNGSGKVFASNDFLSYALTQADGYLITSQKYDDSYINDLIEFCQSNQIKAIIPLSDWDLPILSKNKDKFQSHHISIIVSNEQTIEICNDKWKTYQFLSSLGLPQPKTFIDLDLVRQEIISGNLKFPLFIKPRWDSVRNGVVAVDSLEELNVFYPRVLREVFQSGLRELSQEEENACIIIQEKIKGYEYELDIFNDLKGSFISTVATQNIVKYETAKITDKKPFENIVKLITDHLNPEAAISADCFVTGTGDVVVLGLNGRFGDQYPFVHLSGINFPKQMVEWLKGFPTSDIYFSHELDVIGMVNSSYSVSYNEPVQKPSKKLNILITTAQKNAYRVRYFKSALGNHGKVFAGNSIMTGALLEADEYVITPLVKSDSYIDFLINYCREKHISAIISFSDFDIPVLVRSKERFKEHGITLLLSDEHVIETCNDKWKAYQFLSSLGLPQPKTYIDLDLLKQDIQNGRMSFPIIIKPRCGWDSLGVYEVTRQEELDVMYKKSHKALLNSTLKYEAELLGNACIIMQEKIVGAVFGFNLFNDLNGNYVTTVVIQELRTDSGKKYASQVADVKLFENTAKLVSSHLKHILMMDIDFFLTSSGEIVILDLNPRFGGLYPLAHLAGANFPKQIVEWLMGGSTLENNISVKTGVMGYKDRQLPVRC